MGQSYVRLKSLLNLLGGEDEDQSEAQRESSEDGSDSGWESVRSDRSNADTDFISDGPSPAESGVPPLGRQLCLILLCPSDLRNIIVSNQPTAPGAALSSGRPSIYV